MDTSPPSKVYDPIRVSASHSYFSRVSTLGRYQTISSLSVTKKRKKGAFPGKSFRKGAFLREAPGKATGATQYRPCHVRCEWKINKYP